MTTVEVRLNLPDQVALEAQRAGLLSDEAMSGLIEEALRREAGSVYSTRWRDCAMPMFRPSPRKRSPRK